MPVEAVVVASGGSIATDFLRPVYCLFGLPFDAVTLDQTVAHVREAARLRRRCFISTPNLNFVVGSRSDAEFRDSVLRCDLSVPDGTPLIWVARVLGLPIRERVTGSSLFEALRRPHAPSLRVFFFGGPEGSAQAANESLQDPRCGVSGVGYRSPGFGSVEEMSDPATIAAINGSDADFLLVALGAAKGQRWIEANLSRLRPPVVGHLGAVVNFVAGRLRRAPARWQRGGLEWLWRIREEPALWRRYAGDGFAFVALFATRVIPAAIDARLNRPRPETLAASSIATSIAAGVTTLDLSGPWIERHSAPLRSALAAATTEPGPIVVDLSGVDFVDSACVALLLLLYGHQTKVGQPVEFRGIGPALRRRLWLHGAEFLR